MRLYLGSDHGGYQLKGEIEKYLKDSNKYDVVDLGIFENIPTDYPDIAREVAEKVVENHGGLGILICGTGIGVSIAANRIKGIRAALCFNEYMAEMARKHNNANILCLGARVVGSELAKSIVDKFLSSEFLAQEEKYVRRVDKMDTSC